MTRKPAPLRRRSATSVFEAFRELVYMDGTAGVAKLADFMGLRIGTLYNKADAGDDTHHQPTLRDLIQATHFRADFRALDALNEQFGRASFDCTRFEQVSDMALLELVCQFGKENGEFHRAMAAALAGAGELHASGLAPCARRGVRRGVRADDAACPAGRPGGG